MRGDGTQVDGCVTVGWGKWACESRCGSMGVGRWVWSFGYGAVGMGRWVWDGGVWDVMWTRGDSEFNCGSHSGMRANEALVPKSIN